MVSLMWSIITWYCSSFIPYSSAFSWCPSTRRTSFLLRCSLVIALLIILNIYTMFNLPLYVILHKPPSLMFISHSLRYIFCTMSSTRCSGHPQYTAIFIHSLCLEAISSMVTHKPLGFFKNTKFHEVYQVPYLIFPKRVSPNLTLLKLLDCPSS